MIRKTIITLLYLILLSIPLTTTGCSTAGTSVDEGTITTREYAFSDFTEVEMDTGFTAEIIRDDSFSIRVTASESFLENLKVQHQHDTLSLHVSPLHTELKGIREVVITVPQLKRVKLATGTTCVIRGFDSGEDMAADVSLGSELSGDIEADEIHLKLETGSKAILNGSCNELILDASGGSTAELDGLDISDATITLASGSKATVNVKDSMDVDLSLGSTLFYTGSPTVNSISITGGSRMRPK